jgi:heat shock protein HslJ
MLRITVVWLAGMLIVGAYLGHAPAQTAQAPASVELEDTYWKLTEAGGKTIKEDEASRTPYVQLGAERRISGTGGCNRLTGTYELRGDELVFGAVATTMMACPDAVMKQERAMLDALRVTTSYRITGDKLELMAHKKVVARFTAEREKL